MRLPNPPKWLDAVLYGVMAVGIVTTVAAIVVALADIAQNGCAR